MPVKIRLARRGRRKAPYYHIVVADVRAPRDGRFIEKIGSYNPMTVPASIDLDTNKALDWLSKGAQPTDTARSILRFKGVMYLKHLQRGVSKGAFDQEEADRLYREWMDSKDEQIEARRAKEKKKREDYLRRLSGKPGDSKVVDHSAATEELEEFREAAGEAEPAVEEVKDESGSVAEEKPAAATEEVVAAAQEEE